MNTDLERLLGCHDLSMEQYESTGLKWPDLLKISDHHRETTAELRTTASFIAERLQGVPAVHSLKVRIKDPDHLIAKIIRKKLDRPELTFNVASYEDMVTDLIGIRALHLFKDDWKAIHEFVTNTWKLHEPPTAYVRDGDPGAFLDAFKSANCEVHPHPMGYRSVHYLIECNATVRRRIAELQVRTIFEEGWSEIDHRLRYPLRSVDQILVDLLQLLNRFAGNADEMGSYTKNLSGFLKELDAKESERQRSLDELEKQMRNAVSQLQISESKKAALEAQIIQMRKSSSSAGPFSTHPTFSVDMSAFTAPRISISDSRVSFLRTCSVCGKDYPDDGRLSSLISNRCGECGRLLQSESRDPTV